MTRDEFDALLEAAVRGVMASAPVPLGASSTADSDAAREEAALLEAEAREFADAVDRDGKRVDYGAAVLLEGARGQVVVSAADFDRCPGYWRTVAGGAGHLDRLVEGTELIPVLQAAANRAPAPTE